MASGLRWPLIAPMLLLTLPPKDPTLVNTMSLASLILPAETARGECMRLVEGGRSAVESGRDLWASLLLAWIWPWRVREHYFMHEKEDE